MALILALETSASFCGVALSNEGKVEYSAVWFPDQGHAKVLAPMVHMALQLRGIAFSDLDAVAIGSGPGSYTGLRISTSLAKGICFGSGKPLIAVGTMENLAFQAIERHPRIEYIVTLLDARRDEVYVAVFNRQMEFVLTTQALILKNLDLPALLKDQSALLVGSGAQKTAAHFSNPQNWFTEETLTPTAETTGKLAYRKWEENQFADLASFEPDYIKPVFVTQPRR